MRVLFTTPKTEDLVGARNLYFFEVEVARQATCKWSGEGWEGHRRGEKLPKTVKRLYKDNPPDWVFGSTSPKPRPYRTAGRIIDLHRSPKAKLERINSLGYDHMFFTYRYMPYASEPRDLSRWRPWNRNFMWSKVEAEKTWLPWSYEPREYHPSEKPPLYDVAFLGDIGLPIYPLRTKILKLLPRLCKEKGWRLLTRSRIPGKVAERSITRILADPELREQHLAGSDYAEALRRTRVFIFGTSAMDYFIKKWVEAMGSGACVLADAPLMAEELGLRNGRNYVEIDEASWRRRLGWVLENEDDRRRIAEAGHGLAYKRHRNEVRAAEMLKALKGHG